MESLEIAERLKRNFSSEIVEVRQFRDQVFVSLKKEKIREICRYLHDDPDLYMEFLSDLCGVDYPDRRYRFEVIYNMYSMKHNHRIIIKALLTDADLSVDSVESIWKTANWHEREACDMYGIVFNGHPDLRRILMPDDWEGYPLRKDYPLKGNRDKEYRSFEELKELHSHDNEWNITS